MRNYKKMGLIHVTTVLRAREKAPKKCTTEFLVDTGATDSMAPAKELKKARLVDPANRTLKRMPAIPLK